MVQLFAEVRRHQPSVIFIPNVDVWYSTVAATVTTTFLSLLRTLTATDPVLLLGIIESDATKVDPKMIKDLFGFSRKNQFELGRPDKVGLWRLSCSIVQGVQSAEHLYIAGSKGLFRHHHWIH